MKKTILIIFALILISGVVAADFPPNPSAFYGTAKYTNGQDVQDGRIVTAELNGVESGTCTVKDGKYGYGQDTLIVLDYNRVGGTVKFYINGEKAEKEAEFVDKGVTELDLTVKYTPSTSNNNNNNYNPGGGTTPRNNNDKKTDTTTTSTGTSTTSNGDDNEENDEQDSGLGILETETRGGITGAIIGVFGTGGTIGILIFIIAVVAIAIFVNVMRKKEKAKLA